MSLCKYRPGVEPRQQIQMDTAGIVALFAVRVALREYAATTTQTVLSDYRPLLWIEKASFSTTY